MQDLTLSALDTELRNLKKWALQNNISGADHFAWPKGRFTPEMIEVAERYFVSAGMVSHYINQALPTFTPMRMARRGITAGTTLQNIKDEIDAAIANNTSIELLFHKIVPTGATGDTEYNASDFSAVIDYIASSGIPVRTISEVVYGYCDADGTKLDGIEANADVTDATNVAAAGAVMESDTSTASMGFVVDEDDMASNSATKIPTQQSVKAYVDSVDSGNWTRPSSTYVVIPSTGASSTAAIAKNRATPHIVKLPPGNIDGLQISVATGQADTETRLGIYNVDTYLRTGTLIVDAGVVDTTSNGTKTASFSPTYIKGGYYALVAISQGTGATPPTIRTIGTSGNPTQEFTVFGGATGDYANVTPCFYNVDGITGALPSTWSTNNNVSPGGQTTVAPKVGVRYAV